MPSLSYFSYASFQSMGGGRRIGCVLAESQQLSCSVRLDFQALLILCGMLASWNVAKPFPITFFSLPPLPLVLFSFGPDLVRKNYVES